MTSHAPGRTRCVGSASLAIEELVRALHAGAKPGTLRPIAALVVECDARLEKLTDRRLAADETSMRRQRIAGEALENAEWQRLAAEFGGSE